MTDPAPVDLIHLADTDGNRCIVRVTGRYQPGVLAGHDLLRADVLVSTSFVDARLNLFLSYRDLDAWQEELSSMAPGGEASLGGGRGLSLLLYLHENGWLTITVDDPDRLTTMIGVRPEQNWVDEHREHLERVRLIWPSEVVETAPGAYEWNPDRKR